MCEQLICIGKLKNSFDSLYCSGVEPYLQYLQSIPAYLTLYWKESGLRQGYAGTPKQMVLLFGQMSGRNENGRMNIKF